MIKRRHSRKADAVLYFPECFSGRIIAYANNGASVWLPELWSFRVHMACERRRPSIKPVTGRALFAINMRADQQIGFTGRNRRALRHFPVNAGMERNADNLAFQREGL